jgi:TPR repeat protein
LHYFQLAAAQGNALGEYNLGFMYDYGEGVPQDYATAVHYYRLAAAQGDADAAAAVARLSKLIKQ